MWGGGRPQQKGNVYTVEHLRCERAYTGCVCTRATCARAAAAPWPHADAACCLTLHASRGDARSLNEVLVKHAVLTDSNKVALRTAQRVAARAALPDLVWKR